MSTATEAGSATGRRSSAPPHQSNGAPGDGLYSMVFYAYRFASSRMTCESGLTGWAPRRKTKCSRHDVLCSILTTYF